MRGKTHLAVGALSSLLIAKWISNVDLNIITVNQALILGAIGGVLPDCDHASSMVGSKIPIIPHLLIHRGPTHTPYFALLVTFFLSLANIPTWMLMSFCGAIISHCLGDMLTADGLKFFKFGPFFTKTYRLPILTVLPMLESIIEILSYFLIFNIQYLI